MTVSEFLKSAGKIKILDSMQDIEIVFVYKTSDVWVVNRTCQKAYGPYIFRQMQKYRTYLKILNEQDAVAS